MRRFIIKITDRFCLRPNLVGSKARNLATLLMSGHPVPPFFVVSTKVFYRYFKRFRHSQKGLSDAVLWGSYEEAKSFFASMNYRGQEMPASFWDNFEKNFISLQRQESESEFSVAVRSSSPLEDSAMHSFAGQFISVLDVKDISAAWEAVKQCWLSLWGENVQSYLKHFHQSRLRSAMAVVIQKMVTPLVSGVLFTSEPVSGDASMLLIEFSPHSPDSVVSGRVEPYRIYTNKETMEATWIYPGEMKQDKNAGTSSFHAQQLLSEKQLHELVKLGRDLERRFHDAQDVEWAVDQHGLWLLQSRPLTTTLTNERQRKDEHGDLWTDYFFVERFVDPATPLGWSVIGKWIEQRALREPLYYLGFDQLSRRKDLTRLFDYHPFTRVEVFRSLYSVVPDFMISEDKRRAFLEGYRRPFWLTEFIRRFPYISMRLLFRDTNWFPPLHLRAYERFLIRYLKQLKTKQPSYESMDIHSLKKKFAQLESLTDEFLSYHRWSITFADMFYHSLEFFLRFFFPETPVSTCVNLLSGLSGNKTVQANLELSQLSQLLARMIEDTGQHASGQGLTTAKMKKHLDHPDFRSRLESFLRRHGHRSQNLDPYYPPWRDNPDFVIKVISEMSSDLQVTAAFQQSQNNAVENRRQAELLVFSVISQKGRWSSLVIKPIFKFILKLAQSFSLLRENQRYYWHLALAEKRRIILEVGHRLTKRKALSDPEKIFFLTRDEFYCCLNDKGDLSFIERQTQKRYKDWKQAQRKDHFDNRNQRPQQAKVRVLQGLGVSAGKIQARATVVRSLEQAQQMKPGRILVTSSVDPAWTPVFAKAAGLVLEVGGILSHASIVAREFRLPAVTSVARATSLIKDDQLLALDGQQGTVTLIREE